MHTVQDLLDTGVMLGLPADIFPWCQTAVCECLQDALPASKMCN